MLAVAAQSAALSGCLILERKDFVERFTPLALRTDENATYPIGDIIRFDLDAAQDLEFVTQVIDETPQRPLEARWGLDGALVRNNIMVPANNTGGHTRDYGDTLPRGIFAGLTPGSCHELRLYVSHQFYDDSPAGWFLPIVPDSGDIAVATWHIVAVDIGTPTGSCEP